MHRCKYRLKKELSRRVQLAPELFQRQADVDGRAAVGGVIVDFGGRRPAQGALDRLLKAVVLLRKRAERRVADGELIDMRAEVGQSRLLRGAGGLQQIARGALG